MEKLFYFIVCLLFFYLPTPGAGAGGRDVYDFQIEQSKFVARKCKINGKRKKSKVKLTISENLNDKAFIKLDIGAAICIDSNKRKGMRSQFLLPHYILHSGFIAELKDKKNQQLTLEKIPSVKEGQKNYKVKIKALKNKKINLKGKVIETEVVSFEWFRENKLVHGPIKIFMTDFQELSHISGYKNSLSPIARLEIAKRINKLGMTFLIYINGNLKQILSE